jgi:hypothetical protein
MVTTVSLQHSGLSKGEFGFGRKGLLRMAEFQLAVGRDPVYNAASANGFKWRFFLRS